MKESYLTDTKKKVHRHYLTNLPNTGFVQLPLQCWENSDRDEMGLSWTTNFCLYDNPYVSNRNEEIVMIIKNTNTLKRKLYYDTGEFPS